MAHLHNDAYDQTSLVTVTRFLLSDRVKWQGSCYQFLYFPDGCVAGSRSSHKSRRRRWHRYGEVTTFPLVHGSKIDTPLPVKSLTLRVTTMKP